MGFEDLTVEGYRYHDITWGAAPPILGDDDLVNEDRVSITALELREHGLAGGEIHLELTADNRISADPGYWYAIKCDHDAQSSEDVVGTIHIKRMIGDDVCVDEMETQLDELDRSHLLDRLTSEVLSWHAAKCGPGPHNAPKQKRAAKP